MFNAVRLASRTLAVQARRFGSRSNRRAGTHTVLFGAAAVGVVTAVASVESAQDNVISGCNQHAAYVWIHLAPTADAKACAKIAAGLPALVDRINPPKERDDSNRLTAGAAFSAEFLQKADAPFTPPHTVAYRTRQGMPATGGDIFFHIKSDDRSAVYELTREIADAFPAGSIARISDTYGFVFKNGRDLSGFIDGTENPADEESRTGAAIIPGRNGSYVMTQLWVHNFAANKAMSVAQQEAAVGRTKADSIELDDKVRPATSHVSRMEIFDGAGKKINIVRQSQPWGTVGGEAGLFFIAYFNDPKNMNRMLDRMTGDEDGLKDGVMTMTNCVSGQFWYVPSKKELAQLAGDGGASASGGVGAWLPGPLRSLLGLK